jgi:hypothetical protein
MKNAFAVTAAILFTMAGCTGSKPSADGPVTVDVTANYPKKELILQDFLDVEYIPLETGDEFVTMAYVQYVGKDVIVVRNRNRSSDGDIFFFDRHSGKGLKKINRQGQGAEEYIFLLWVITDEESGEIFVNDHYSGKIYVYGAGGEFKRSFPMAKKDMFYDEIHHFDRAHLICHDGNAGFSGEAGSLFHIVSKQDGSISGEIRIPYEKKISTIVRTVNEATNTGFSAGPRNHELIPYRDNWLLAEPSSDTIYRLLPGRSIVPFIARTPSIQSLSPEIFLFPGVITDRYYFMQAVKKEYDFGTGRGFPRTDLVYDREEKTVFECTVYNDDFLDKKPVNMVYGDVTLINNDIAFVQKLEAWELVEALGKGRLKGRLKEIAATLDEDSNPVLMLAGRRE